MPRCPSCFSPMTRVEEDGVRECRCPNCFGTWIQKSALMSSARHLAEATAARTPAEALAAQTDIAELAATVVESNQGKTLSCKVCNKDMLKGRLNPLIPVIADHCAKCDGVWLDVGELALFRKLFAELQNTTDPEVIAKRDKIALAMLDWENHETATHAAREAADAALRAMMRNGL